jgi:aminoglycoside phosphotransferase (APT) family kinase protein
VDAGIRWAESVWERRVTGVRRLTGGFTSTMLGLTADTGEKAVLRLMAKEPWRTYAEGLLGREAAVQRQLAHTEIPAPRSIAVDLSGVEAGVPAHLMSWLPGRLCLDAAGDDVLEPLAEALAGIHRFDPGAQRPRDFQSWAKKAVPPWTRRPGLWERALRLVAEPAPAYQGVFLHRDFHLGNVLWSRGRVSGVVDWVETSWGPADLDIAHTATYLAMLHGAGVAARFTDICGRRVGTYWNVLDIAGYLPDPVKVVLPWRDAGREVSDELARWRLEERLAQVLGRG